MGILKKSVTMLTVTIVLSMALAFLLFNSLATPLLAADCAVGGCDCGECSNCLLTWGRIPVPTASIVYYGCSCSGVYCTGFAY